MKEKTIRVTMLDSEYFWFTGVILTIPAVITESLIWCIASALSVVMSFVFRAMENKQ